MLTWILRASIALSIALVLVSNRSNADWFQLDGPEPPNVAALADDGSILFQGSNSDDAGDVFRSLDGGDTWHNAGLPNGGVNMFFVHGGAVYVGTYFGGAHRSTDGGETWVPVGSGLPGGSTYSAMTALDAQTLFIGSDDFFATPIYRSTDGGATWAETPQSPVVRARSMAAIDGTVLVGSWENGIYRSTDGGGTWSPANVGLPASARVEALAVDGQDLLAGVTVPFDASPIGVFRSADAGASWTQVSVDLPEVTDLRIRALATAPGKIYAGLFGRFGGSGLYLSTDGGAHWSRISGSIPADDSIQSLLRRGDEIVVGTPEGAYRTSNDGTTWEYFGFGTAAIRGVGSLLFDGDTLFVGLTTSGGLARGIWRTTDLGGTWLGDPFVPGGSARALLATQGAILAGLYAPTRGVYRSTDGGETWAPSNTGMDPATIINELLELDSIHLAGCYEALYRSVDGGSNWSAVPGMDETTSLVTDGSVIWAGRYGFGVYRSEDLGITWSPESEGLPVDALGINDLALHRGTLFAATNGEGVYRREAGQWVPAGVPSSFVGELISVGGVLVAGTALDDHIYYTTDDGASWIPFREGYAGGEVYAFATDGEYLFAGSRGHAIWARPLADLPTVSTGDRVPGTSGHRGLDRRAPR